MTTTPVAGEEPIVAVAVGTRIRDPRHPELTGRIAGYEWNEPGVLSAIPRSRNTTQIRATAGIAN